MPEAMSSDPVEERIVQAETWRVWVAIRARGAEWSRLTPAEAARIGQQWVDNYGSSQNRRKLERTEAVPGAALGVQSHSSARYTAPCSCSSSA